MTFRAAEPRDFTVAGLWWLSAVGAGAAAFFLHDRLLIAAGCPFKSISGFACPTCGTTRAVDAMLAGKAAAALLLNPLMVTLGAAFILAGLVAPAWVALKGPVPDGLTHAPRRLRVTAALAFAANWIYLVVAGV